MQPLSAAVAFLKVLFGSNTERNIYFASLANSDADPNEPTERRVITRDPSVIDGFARKWDRSGRGLYFAVGTVRAQRRVKEEIVETPFIHLDIDFKSVDASEGEILSRLRQARCPPSIIVRSGGGLHCYWLLKESVDTQASMERIENVMRQLADLFGGDLSVCEVSRLMRLPGSHNSKYGDMRQVTVEHMSEVRYELDDLEEWLSEVAPVIKRKTADGKAVAAQRSPGETNPYLEYAKKRGFTPSLDVDRMLREMTFGNIHATQVSVTASLLSTGHTVDETVDIVINATDEAVGDYGMRWNWTRERHRVKRMCETWLRKHPPQQKAQQPQQADVKDQVRSELANRGQVDQPGQVVQLATARKPKPAKKTNAAAHLVLAEALLAVLDERSEAMLFTDSGAYRYVDHLWVQQTDGAMRAWLDAELQTAAFALQLEPNNRLMSEARGVIMRDTGLHRRNVRWDAHGQVPTRSGLVNPRTGGLTPAAPEHHCTWRIECHYDPEATCPNWVRMLEDVFAKGGPSDRVLHVLLVQEMLGAGLVDRKPKALSRALILEGGSNTGKSGLLDVLGGLYSDDCHGAPLDTLGSTHALMPFARRAPWVLHEAFDQSKWHLSSVVKALISGDPVQINVKGGPQYDHRFTAPIFWGTNSPPKFKEATRAITNRIVVLKCRREFDPDKPVGAAAVAAELGYGKPSDLVLATELPGVLAWAVTGLRRALARGNFILPDDAREAEQEIRRDSNVIAGFVEDCVERDIDGRVSGPDFSAAFSSWWLEHKGEDRRIPSSESVGKALVALADTTIAVDPKLRDKHRRYYCGLRLNEEGMRHWRNAVTSEAYVFQGRKASTTEATGDPNDTIPPAWMTKASVIEMRREQQLSSVTQVSPEQSSSQLDDPPF